jgi:hypothetical protein
MLTEIAAHSHFQPIKRCTVTGGLNFFTTREAGGGLEGRPRLNRGAGTKAASFPIKRELMSTWIPLGCRLGILRQISSSCNKLLSLNIFPV